MDKKAQEWCQFEGPTSGNGVGAFTVRYDENRFDGVRRGLRRQAVIKVLTGDEFTSVTIFFRQSGITPKVVFAEKSYYYDYNTTEMALPVNTNLSVYEAEDMEYKVVGDWIISHYMTVNGAEINLTADENRGEVARVAEVEVSYTDAWGDTFRATTTLVQNSENGATGPSEPSEPEPDEPSEPSEPEQDMFESLNPEEDDDEF